MRCLEGNSQTIKTYFEIERLLVDGYGGEKRSKYGDNLIKNWSKEYVSDINYFLLHLK